MIYLNNCFIFIKNKFHLLSHFFNKLPVLKINIYFRDNRLKMNK